MSDLAINGGAPVRSKDRLFPAYNPIGAEEKAAAMRVLDSGILSKFLGCWDPMFYGGEEVQAFEREWEAHFGVTHAVSMNSATSGIIAALGALGISPGDEVIVPPYSMCVSGTAPLFYGAVPVFADIEPLHFCLDPESIESAITEHTKAIIVVDLFGMPHDADAVNAIAKRYDLPVIVDCAQAPGARYKGAYAGTRSTIGVYSFNYHKHIHMGEGTMVVTDDDRLAERLQLIRNHAEAVVEDKGVTDLVNMVGQNYRLTEIQAAIGREQLKKLDSLVAEHQKNCAYIDERCQDMPGFAPSPIRGECSSAFYQQAFFFDQDKVGVPRERFIEAICAELPPTQLRESEGPLISGGYVKPIYLMPLFQKQIAFGSEGYPFKSPYYKGVARYEAGMCPVVEELYASKLVIHDIMRPGMTAKDLDDVIEVFHKVYRNRRELV